MHTCTDACWWQHPIPSHWHSFSAAPKTSKSVLTLGGSLRRCSCKMSSCWIGPFWLLEDQKIRNVVVKTACFVNAAANKRKRLSVSASVSLCSRANKDDKQHFLRLAQESSKWHFAARHIGPRPTAHMCFLHILRFQTASSFLSLKLSLPRP